MEAISKGQGRFSHGFEASVERVRQLDRRMRGELRASLEYVLGELEQHVSFDRAGIGAFLRRLDAAPISPQAFLVYGDLVIAIDNDELGEAARLVSELIQEPGAGPVLKITAMPDPATDKAGGRLVRFMNSDPAVNYEMRAPAPAAAAEARRKIEESFRLLDKADPDLAAETREIVREIILITGGEAADRQDFSAASTFLLWGAIVVNTWRLGDEIAVVLMLAHESAHNLLFGFSPDDPLVLNDPEARYKSPLRADPRPMEGVYHAVFVTARMYRAVKNLAESGLLSDEQTRKARTEMEKKARIFESGMTVIREHAQLTPLGSAILDGAIASMPKVSLG